ncbi:hypothetical protein [Metabacillus fastidiosus]|jgi:sulfur relay (sulfurtransferase) complex TusBCD TusD component (DsrE family)|nr:hypothetical protein [Metabacillus fastidiosus]MEC2074793.1 hypothetical protein [Metabacillus fastidiosus]MEC2075850.1 hypothetical protein [Metabacillus fastidiosus]
MENNFLSVFFISDAVVKEEKQTKSKIEASFNVADAFFNAYK